MLVTFGIRHFADANGVEWDVWEAHPRLADRRRARERRALERTGARDRRVHTVAPKLPMADAEGWLVFRSDRDDRRRTPIPEDWLLLSELQLRDVLSRSRATGPLPRMRCTPPPTHGQPLR